MQTQESIRYFAVFEFKTSSLFRRYGEIRIENWRKHTKSNAFQPMPPALIAFQEKICMIDREFRRN